MVTLGSCQRIGVLAATVFAETPGGRLDGTLFSVLLWSVLPRSSDRIVRVSEDHPEIVLLRERIDPGVLAELVGAYFEDMVKYVVDVRLRVLAVGGELHADAEQVLLQAGSTQADLWGANYYPGRVIEERIEFTSLINIRPAQGNRAMEVRDPALRKLIAEISLDLLGGQPS